MWKSINLFNHIVRIDFHSLVHKFNTTNKLQTWEREDCRGWSKGRPGIPRAWPRSRSGRTRERTRWRAASTWTDRRHVPACENIKLSKIMKLIMHCKPSVHIMVLMFSLQNASFQFKIVVSNVLKGKIRE